jgi:hypothetical protein
LQAKRRGRLPEALRDTREQTRERREPPQFRLAFLAARQVSLHPPSFVAVRRAEHIDAKRHHH